MRNYPLCIDCGKITGDYYSKRCSKCYHKTQIKKDAITKIIYYCLDCKKKIGLNSGIYGQGRCGHCEQMRRNKENIGMIGRKGKQHPRFGKISHGKGEYYKGIYMRSSWEVIFAKWLDMWELSWLYEPKAFDLGNTTYTPDFYVQEINSYIEVKGFWREDAKKKFDLFREKYCNIKIKILGKEQIENCKFDLIQG